MPVVKQGDNFIIRGVPVFDEHEDQSRHSNLRTVDRPKLETILSNSLARLQTEYELPVAFDAKDRHTPKPGEEYDPPPVKGGYRNFRMGEIGPPDKRRAAILADFRIPAAYWRDVQGKQRRSVEIFPDTLELDTCVLLGSKAPARDLGPLTTPVQYSRDGREVVRYELDRGEHEEPDVEPDGDADDESPKESKSMLAPEDLEQIRAILAETIPGIVKDTLNEVMDGDADDDGVPDAEDEMMEGAPDADGDGTPDALESTGMAVNDPDPAAKEKEMFTRIRKEDEKRAVEKYEKKFREQDAAIKSLQRERDVEKYTRKLDDLQNQGVELDRAAELKDILELPNDAAREKHIKRIATHYSRDITGYQPLAPDAERYSRTDRQTPDPSGMTPETAAKIMAKATELGSWDAGRAAVLNGKA